MKTATDIIETKDLGCLTWNEAMAAVENDPNWRLPTIDELDWMYENPDKIDKPFDANDYWASTETTKARACLLYFANGIRISDSKIFTYRSRAIRRDQFDVK